MLPRWRASRRGAYGPEGREKPGVLPDPSLCRLLLQPSDRTYKICRSELLASQLPENGISKDGGSASYQRKWWTVVT
jgi:hypothetical protein